MPHRDLEVGSDADLNQPSQTSPEDFDSDDSSWPLYSMYSKIAQEDDNKMVERCQKDVDGTLVFSGLFSATIAALLSVSIPDLKPNSQDTSAFYLANIYGVLGNPNVSHVIEPPAFSPPRYAVWVNSLWFLSLSFSLLAATIATVDQSWALRYISVVQFPIRAPDKRARVREIFADDERGPYTYWGTGPEPFFLHISVFLFFIGSLIYLFNINRAVFGAVLWFFLFVSIRYVQVTVEPIFKPAMLFRSPFTPLALKLYLGILYAVSQVCSWIGPLRSLSKRTRSRYRVLCDHYSDSFEDGKVEEAREIASKPTSQVDAGILKRMLFGLDDDDSLERFFDSIPGFCNSKLVNLYLPDWVGDKFRQTLNGFLDRTFTSKFISEAVRSDRLISCLNAAHAALGPDAVQGILHDIFKGRHNETLQSVETGHSLRRWGNTRDDFDVEVRRIVASIVVNVQERDDSWVMLVKEEFGIPEGVLRDNLEHGDSVLLAILIHAARQALRTRLLQRDVLQSLSKFDIHNTLPGLRRDFCALWNEIILEARQDASGDPIDILDGIRDAHIALHRGTDAALTRFPAPINDDDNIRRWPWSYRPCDIASHSSDSTPSHVIVSSTDPPPTQLANLSDDWLHRSSADHTPLHAPGLPQPPSSADLIRPMREMSQAIRVAPTSLSFPPPDPVPVTITPGPNSLSVPHPAAAPSHPLESKMQQDDRGAALDITELSLAANPIPQSIPSGAVLQAIEEPTSVPRSIIPDLLSSSVVLPTPCSDVSPMEPPLSVESAPIKPEHISHTLGSPSSSLTTTRSHIIPQVMDARVAASTGAPIMHEHDETRDLNHPIPMEVFHYPHQPTPSTPDIADDILPPGDHQHG